MCGFIKINIDENITDSHINNLTRKINSIDGNSIANSWKMMSVMKSRQEFEIFSKLYISYKRKIVMNGLLRAIVFWLSPARKRAAEKVFHPSNMIHVFNDI